MYKCRRFQQLDTLLPPNLIPDTKFVETILREFVSERTPQLLLIEDKELSQENEI